MAGVEYQLILEGVTPEADTERVRSFLERVAGDGGVPVNVLEAFPMEMPGRFDLKRATEWMDALSRAGIRGRVDVVTATAGGAEEEAAASAASAAAAEAWPLPHRLWLELLSVPEAAFARVRNGALGPPLLFGWALAALGNAMGYPAELVLLNDVAKLGLAPRGPAATFVSTILVEPALGLLMGALMVFLLLRLVRVEATFAHVLAIVALAQAPAVLAAIPVLGGMLAFLGFLWLTGIGVRQVYALEPRRLAAFFLAPPAVLLIGVGLMGLLFVALVGGLDGEQFMRWIEHQANR